MDMQDNKRKIEALHLYNRTISLLKLTEGHHTEERNKEIASQYNILRADVKKIVLNKRAFTRLIHSVWCLKYSIHIPIGLLIIALILSSSYFLGGLIVLIVSLVVIFAVLLGLSPLIPVVVVWGQTSSLGEVHTKLLLLRQYLEDFIVLNYPADAYKFDEGHNENLGLEIEILHQRIMEIEEKLEEKSIEINQYEIREDFSKELVSLQKRLRTHYKNLLRMQEEKAKGGFDIKLLNQIDDEEGNIKQIEERIEELEELDFKNKAA